MDPNEQLPSMQSRNGYASYLSDVNGEQFSHGQRPVEQSFYGDQLQNGRFLNQQALNGEQQSGEFSNQRLVNADHFQNGQFLNHRPIGEISNQQLNFGDVAEQSSHNKVSCLKAAIGMFLDGQNENNQSSNEQSFPQTSDHPPGFQPRLPQTTDIPQPFPQTSNLPSLFSQTPNLPPVPQTPNLSNHFQQNQNLPFQQIPNLPPSHQNPDIPPFHQNPDIPPFHQNPDIPPFHQNPSLPPPFQQTPYELPADQETHNDLPSRLKSCSLLSLNQISTDRPSYDQIAFRRASQDLFPIQQSNHPQLSEWRSNHDKIRNSFCKQSNIQTSNEQMDFHHITSQDQTSNQNLFSQTNLNQNLDQHLRFGSMPNLPINASEDHSVFNQNSNHPSPLNDVSDQQTSYNQTLDQLSSVSQIFNQLSLFNENPNSLMKIGQISKQEEKESGKVKLRSRDPDEPFKSLDELRDDFDKLVSELSIVKAGIENVEKFNLVLLEQLPVIGERNKTSEEKLNNDANAQQTLIDELKEEFCKIEADVSGSKTSFINAHQQCIKPGSYDDEVKNNLINLKADVARLKLLSSTLKTQGLSFKQKQTSFLFQIFDELDEIGLKGSDSLQKYRSYLKRAHGM